jgi:hypothetical protein
MSMRSCLTATPARSNTLLKCLTEGEFCVPVAQPQSAASLLVDLQCELLIEKRGLRDFEFSD